MASTLPEEEEFLELATGCSDEPLSKIQILIYSSFVQPFGYHMHQGVSILLLASAVCYCAAFPHGLANP